MAPLWNLLLSMALVAPFALNAQVPSPGSVPPHRIPVAGGSVPDTNPRLHAVFFDSSTGALYYLPQWVHRDLVRHHFYDRYHLFFGLNPFYLNGRFASDSVTDVALQIAANGSGARGIAIIHAVDGSVHVLGAGDSTTRCAAEVYRWEVERRSVLPAEPVAGAELLFVGTGCEEPPWEILWWNGSRYVTYEPPID